MSFESKGRVMKNEITLYLSDSQIKALTEEASSALRELDMQAKFYILKSLKEAGHEFNTYDQDRKVVSQTTKYEPVQKEAKKTSAVSPQKGGWKWTPAARKAFSQRQKARFKKSKELSS
jgi:hypothetical protein